MGKHSQTRSQKKKSILINLVFLLASFIVIFGFTIAIWIRGQQEESIIENRPLAKFPRFSLHDFFQGKYQEDLEKSLSDQMLWGQSIKTAMTSGKSEIIGEWQKKLVANIETEEPSTEEQPEKQTENSKEEEKPKGVRKIKYMPISGGNVYHYGDSPYMVFKCRSLKNAKGKIDEMAKSYQKHFKDVDSYFYFVNISKSIDFNKVDETENEFLTYIKQAFSDFRCDG